MQQCRHTTLHGLCLRSSSRMCSVRKVVLRNFAKLTGKHLCQSLFFNKVTGQRPATLLKKRFWYRCFLVDFGKFFKSTCFTEHLWKTAFVYLRIKFEDYRILIVIFVMKFSIVFVYDLKLTSHRILHYFSKVTNTIWRIFSQYGLMPCRSRLLLKIGVNYFTKTFSARSA